MLCYTLVDFGYFIGLKKSHLVPKQVVPYLGFLVDSVHQAFLLMEEKKQNFLSLLRSVLSSPSTDLKTLQRLSGKCISLSLAVPGARLYLNDIYNAIVKSQRHGSFKPILVTGPLKHELEGWLFLESSSGYIPWLLETHHQVKLCSDASSFSWGCVVGPDTFSATIRDYWPFDQSHLHINVKEAWALANALDAFSGSLRDSWVDVYTDSQVLISSWRCQGAKSPDLVVALKRIFSIISSCNIHLNLFYIPSAANPADAPSHVLLLQDSKLSPFAWGQVQARFGGQFGHSADLMALPSNLQCALDGSPVSFIFSVSCSRFFRGQFVCPASLQPWPRFFKPLCSPPPYYSHSPRLAVLLKVNPFLVPLLSLTFVLENSGGLFCNHICLSDLLPRVPSEWFFPPPLKDFFRVRPSLGICRRFVLIRFRIFLNRKK